MSVEGVEGGGRGHTQLAEDTHRMVKKL